MTDNSIKDPNRSGSTRYYCNNQLVRVMKNIDDKKYEITWYQINDSMFKSYEFAFHILQSMTIDNLIARQLIEEIDVEEWLSSQGMVNPEDDMTLFTLAWSR